MKISTSIIPRMREPVNSLTHLGGALAAIIGQVALLFESWPSPVKMISAAVYGLSLVTLFSASAAYHMARVQPSTLQVLRKLDHAAIYLLIAGTYTPFCLNAFTGFHRWGLLGLIWTLALAGILVKIFHMSAPRWLNAGIYVLMGWLVILAAPQMPEVLPLPAITWLVTGGVVYTLGAIIYATRSCNFAPGKFGFHETWHVFVLLGAMAHFAAVSWVIG